MFYVRLWLGNETSILFAKPLGSVPTMTTINKKLCKDDDLVQIES